MILDVDVTSTGQTETYASGEIRVTDQFSESGNVEEFVSPWFDQDAIITEAVAYQVGGGV